MEATTFKRQRWSHSDDQILCEMVNEGMCIASIADAFSRSENAIYSRYWKLQQKEHPLALRKTIARHRPRHSKPSISESQLVSRVKPLNGSTWDAFFGAMCGVGVGTVVVAALARAFGVYP